MEASKTKTLGGLGIMSVQEDIDGKVSSKRKWARVLIVSGIIMTWLSWSIWAITILLKYDEVAQIPIELIYAQLGAGLGAIGFITGERFAKKK